jgi:hypothetical protein
MPHPNPPSHQYELVDADATILDPDETILDPDAAIGHNDDCPTPSANAPPNHHQFQPPPPPLSHPHPPTLPTGQIIDGKNTLQSFDRFVRNDVAVMTTNSATTGEDEAGATRAAALATTTTQDTTHPIAATAATAATTHPPDPQLYTLPTGEIINAKNINQSYDAMAQRNDNYNGYNNKNSVTPPTNLVTENVIVHNSNNPSDTAVPLRVTTNNTDRDHGSGNNNHNSNMPTAHAFVVESQIVVDAEPLQPLQQRQSPAFYIAITTLVIVSLVAAASLGVYCGTGNCKSNSGGTAMSSPNSNSNPTSSEERSVILVEFIKNITLSDESIMVNGTNPESKALTWMLGNYDVLNSTAAMTLNSFTKSPLSFSVQQYYPLLTMWFQQGGVSTKWIDVTGWRVDSNVCNWYGISCRTMDLGDGIGIQNVVTEIRFYNDGYGNNYVGTIPADLGLLPMLGFFDLAFNALTGTLPASIGQWTALTYFDVSYNYGVTGTLPASIEQWSKLIFFDVGYNALTGTLPASIGQWAALTSFASGYNAITGTLPASIGQWTALELFYVQGNALTGTLPESIGEWTALTEFRVSSNALTGTIPPSIGNWSQIQIAYFGENKFTGTMPNGICPNYVENGETLSADCLREITCTCCTLCL